MTALDYITLTGGLFWAVILVIKQAAYYRHHSAVIRSQHYEEKSHD